MGISIPGRKESTLDKVAKGLTVANAGLGIVSNIQGIRKAGAEMDKMEAETAKANDPMARRLKTALSQNETANLQDKGFKLVEPGTKGATDYSAIGPDGNIRMVGLVPPEFVDSSGETAKGVTVPGYSVAPGAKPTTKDAEEVKSLSQARLNVKTTTDKLKELVKKHGSEVMPGPVKDEMDRLIGDLKLQIKDVARLGQLTEGDMKLIEAQIPQTTGWGAMFQSNDRLMKNIDKTLEMADSKLSSAAQARGFQASAAPQKQDEPPPLDHKQFTLNGKTFKSADELKMAAQQELMKRTNQKAVVAR